VGKDQPPDLAALVPSSSIILPDQPGKQSSTEVPKNENLVSVAVSVDTKTKTVPGINSTIVVLYSMFFTWKLIFVSVVVISTICSVYYSERIVFLHYY